MRVHADEEASALARSTRSPAYPLRSDTVLDGELFAPDRLEASRLLNHELSRVIQQTGRPPIVQRQVLAHVILQTGHPPIVQRQVADPCSTPSSEDTAAATGKASGCVDRLRDDSESAGAVRLSPEQALRDQVNRLLATLEGDKSGLADLYQARDEQPWVAAISDYMGGEGILGSLELPARDSFARAEELLKRALALADQGEIVPAAHALQDASASFDVAHRRLHDYREGVIGGASRSITALEVTAAAGAIAAAVATGGAAAGAGLGWGSTAALVGAAGGGYAAEQTVARQGGEMIAGTRREFDWTTVAARGGTEAVTWFVGALAGGALSKCAAGYLGRAALARMSPAELATAARSLGVPLERLTPDLLIGSAKRFLVDLVAGAATTPLVVAVQRTLADLGPARAPRSSEDFTTQVMRTAVEGGLLQLFVGALTHGAARVGIRSGFEPGAQHPSSSADGGTPGRPEGPSRPNQHVYIAETGFEPLSPPGSVEPMVKPTLGRPQGSGRPAPPQVGVLASPRTSRFTAQEIQQHVDEATEVRQRSVSDVEGFSPEEAAGIAEEVVAEGGRHSHLERHHPVEVFILRAIESMRAGRRPREVTGAGGEGARQVLDQWYPQGDPARPGGGLPELEQLRHKELHRAVNDELDLLFERERVADLRRRRGEPPSFGPGSRVVERQGAAGMMRRREALTEQELLNELELAYLRVHRDHPGIVNEETWRDIFQAFVRVRSQL